MGRDQTGLSRSGLGSGMSAVSLMIWLQPVCGLRLSPGPHLPCPPRNF